MKKFLVVAVCLGLMGCGSKSEKKAETEKTTPVWNAQESGVKSSLRGLSAVSENVAWASGTQGTVIKTVDGGKTWENVSIAEADTIDFRDIEAFDKNTAVVLSAGLPAVIYKTTDGGKSWEQKYFTMKEGTFYDAMDFWDEQNGIAFGDAMNGRLPILKTTDGGETWSELPFEQRPEAHEGQGGFAASGTCLVTNGDSAVYIGLGGADASLFFSFDRGETWGKTFTPLQAGEPTQGIFSIAFKNKDEGFMVGGDYRGDSLTRINSAYTVNEGQVWFPRRAGEAPKGYRSGVTYFNDLILAVGRESCDYFRDGMTSFQPMEGKYYSVSTTKDGKAVYASGPRGSVAKLEY